jgi:hypothetical protein
VSLPGLFYFANLSDIMMGRLNIGRWHLIRSLYGCEDGTLERDADQPECIWYGRNSRDRQKRFAGLPEYGSRRGRAGLPGRIDER